MGLSKETNAELRAELERIYKRADAIVEVLGEAPAAPVRLAPRTGNGHVVAKRRPARPVQDPPVLGARTGLRELITSTIAAKPGLRPGEIAKRILAGGFVDTAKTKLSLRVSNEAHRMAKPGGRLRKRNGKFYLALEPGRTESGARQNDGANA